MIVSTIVNAAQTYMSLIVNVSHLGIDLQEYFWSCILGNLEGLVRPQP